MTMHHSIIIVKQKPRNIYAVASNRQIILKCLKSLNLEKNLESENNQELGK
jgi:hypothetical protein